MVLLPLAPTITLGPASLSLPELAKALTAAGMPTEASPALRDRGAFVSLRGRSPEAVRALLGEALDVTFRFDGVRWTMAIDPVAQERDRLSLIAYKRQAAERAREWAADRDRVRAGRSYAVLERDVPAMTANLKTMPTAATEERKTALRAFNDVMSALLLLQPSGWIAARDARSAKTIYDAFERSTEVSHSFRDTGLPDSVLQPQSPGRSPARRLVTTWSYDSETGFFHARTMLGLEDGSATFFQSRGFQASVAGLTFSTTGTEQSIVPAEGATLEETFGRMGRPSPESTTAASLPTSPTAPGPTGTLSLALERLGAAGLEAAFELSPRFEVSPVASNANGAPLAEISLRDILTIPPASLPTYLPEDLAWARPMVESVNPRPSIERRFPWRAKGRDGVWILTNPLAFLDRAHPLSPVPSLLAGRILARMPSDAPRPSWSRDGLPNWGLLEALARALPPGTTVPTSGYRDLWTLPGYVDFLPIVRIVGTVPAPERAALWRAARTKDGATWPLGGGTLRLALAPLDSDPTHTPYAQINGRWSGPHGEEVTGGVAVDARGLGDSARA